MPRIRVAMASEAKREDGRGGEKPTEFEAPPAVALSAQASDSSTVVRGIGVDSDGVPSSHVLVLYTGAVCGAHSAAAAETVC